jgi:hypothetical protein
MRAWVLLPVVGLLGCPQGVTPDSGMEPPDAGDAGQVDSGVAPPADAGVPPFTAADFCQVFAEASCRWAVSCGERTPAEEADCVAKLRHLCPRPLKFDATAASVCLLRLESSRCGTRAERCDEAWPPAVLDGGGCLDDSECLTGVCALDGGCGSCAPPLGPGSACDGTWPCDGTSRCADGDGGVQCRPRLADGANCVGLGDVACASGRCKLGKCASASPGAPCTSGFSCPAALYCDPVRGNCRVPVALGGACDNQPACGSKGAACLGGLCLKIPPFSIAFGSACTESAQCAWGLACDVRAAAPTCVRRIDYGADCELKALDVWDPRCPYLAMCHPATRVCADSATLCAYPGYCPSGPGPGEPCKAGAICRGQSSCADDLDGGFRCRPTFALPAQSCFEPFGSEACFDSTCAGGVCAAWAAVPACGS